MVGPHWNSGSHHHAALQIVLSDGNPFSIRIDGGQWTSARAVVVNSHVIHEIKDFAGTIVSFSLVPEIKRGLSLQKHVLRGENIRFLENIDKSDILSRLFRSVKERKDSARAFYDCEKFIDTLTGFQADTFNFDDRMLSVLDCIQKNIPDHISASTLAKHIHISEDRFLHLFKEQLGLTLRQYILFQRIMTAVREFLEGRSLTEAAHEAGFSDSAHFTRNFVEIFGIRPSQVIKYKEIYRVNLCNSLYCYRPVGSGMKASSNICKDCPAANNYLPLKK